MAFEGALAKPLIAPEGAPQRLTSDVLADFLATNYGAQRMVLVGARRSARRAAT